MGGDRIRTPVSEFLCLRLRLFKSACARTHLGV